MNRAPVILAVAAVFALAGCASKEPAATTAKAEVRAAAADQPAAVTGGQVATDAAPKLCEHGVPADQCTRCNPDLAAVFKETGDWCAEHGVPESHCRQCNPGLRFDGKLVAAAAVPWCKEHSVPEAMCTKCNPKLIAKFIAANDYCREHGYPESACPYCHPEAVKAAGHAPPVFPEPGTKVKLASAETERKAGIVTAVAEARPFVRSLDVVGQLQFDQNRLARLSGRGEAVVSEVKVDVGDRVRKGQALVVLSSGAIGGAQSRLEAAKARVEAAKAALAREQSLHEGGISSRKDVEQARTELAAAKADHDGAWSELRAAGAGDSSTGGRYVLTAPFDGTVVSREATPGRTAGPDVILVEVADVKTIWAMLDVPEEQASAVRPGQRVVVRIDGTQARDGRVSRVGAAIVPQTRTVRVRVDLPNTDGALKAGSFVRASIELGETKTAVLVPRTALQRAQGHDLVFVRTAAGQYDPVNVEVGGRTAEVVEILRGVEPGAVVVTTGAFMLKTEILKDSIGAGCADGH